MDKRFNENLMTLSKGGMELINSNTLYRILFEFNPGLVFFTDHNGWIVDASDTFAEVLGYSKEEIVLTQLEQFIPESEIVLYKEFLKQVLAGTMQHAYTALLHKKGTAVFTRIKAIPVMCGKKVAGIFGFAKDITDIRNSAFELAQSELKFSSIVEQAFIGVYIMEQNGQLSYGNQKIYEILGLEFTRDLNLLEYIHPEDLPNQKLFFDSLKNEEKGVNHSFRMIKRDGTVIDVEAHSQKVYLENARPTVIGAIQDVTERKRVEDLNKYLAYHDSLTDLPNSRLLNEKINQQLMISKKLRQKFAVMILDLDRFKYINDTLGHRIGNKLLKQVSERLQNCLGEYDVLARLGGDEFYVLLPNILHIDEVIKLAETMIKSLEEAFHIDKYELFITVSIGISIYPNDGEDYETLVKHADSALYKAKDRGKNTYQIFNSSMNAEAYKIFTLESDLRKALELKQLELYYQPKVCAISQQIVGAEALIRWNHPEWGMVSPDEFIPLAEETGLIHEMGKWIKETACSQNKAWQNAGLPTIPISINLSAFRFLEKDLISNITEILGKTNLDPEYIEFEITESSLLKNEEVVLSVLDELRKLRIRVSLDDFGTGYSSLSYLKKFRGRIDTLKIDRSFIQDLSQADPNDENFITKSIIELAQHLHMEVVAEGVETVEQLDVLKEYNCNIIQGYLFSKPVSAEEFAALLQKGIIELPAASIRDERIDFEERRKFFRVNLAFPLLASVTLIRIHGRNVELGRTNALIENLCLGGLSFLADIRLPVHRDIILEVETEIFGHAVKLYGIIVRMKEIKSGIYQYGLEISMDESEHPVQLLNKLAILLMENSLVPGCNFVTSDRYSFFTKEKTNKEQGNAK